MRRCVAAAGDLPGASLPDRGLLVSLAGVGWLATARIARRQVLVLHYPSRFSEPLQEGRGASLSPTLLGEPAKQPEEGSEEGMGLQSGTVAPPQGAINLAPTPP